MEDPGKFVPVVASAAPAVREFLYGTWQDSTGPYVTTEVVAFPVVKKTAKRIYYDRDAWRGRGAPEIAFVDRQLMESAGVVYKRSLGWWEPDFPLYAQPPETAAPAAQPDLAVLKAAMAAAHPDRGGRDADFVHARQAYERARQAQRPAEVRESPAAEGAR